MSATELKHIYQLKITLSGAKPPIWRRVLVSSDMTLDQLHLTIQMSMGWDNCHLHQFIANGIFYGIKEDAINSHMGLEDESTYPISQLLKVEKDNMVYEYDFGDGWIHKIILEKILPFNTEQTLPRCIKGVRACPPEDCGGIWGYMELIEILSDPEHSEYDNMMEWLGRTIDPKVFNLKPVNNLLAEYID